MPQHISIRVPWHDHGWDGSVCSHPELNNACLRLKNIYENRDDRFESSICGECMLEHEQQLPCIGEGSAFMSPNELIRETIHPYKAKNPATHGHFLPTEIVFPPYSFPARPFAWLMRDNLKQLAEQYGIQYNEDIEPRLPFKTNWVQEASNHRAVFDAFFRDVEPDRSLCIAYAKQVPFVENHRRVIIGMGFVDRVIPAAEHKHTAKGKLRSMTWETHVCHSIRPEHDNGFVIPYVEMMEYAETHPSFDINSIVVFAPDDAFEEFSYAAEHVSHDSVIEVILSCLNVFEIINSCLDEDYSNVIDWLNARLADVWEDRGAFPGLGAMLTAFELPVGMLVAKEIKDSTKEYEDIWSKVDDVFNHPYIVLHPTLAKKVSPLMTKTWNGLSAERKDLFKLLSRMSISIEQARVLYYQNECENRRIYCSDAEIIENPYVLYERTRLNGEGLYLSVKKIDRALFPVASIREKYPLNAPSCMESDNDPRRIRAVAVAALELAAEEGHTILPCNQLVDSVRSIPLDPICPITLDILNAIEPFLSEHIIRRTMKDDTPYYKLTRLVEFDEVIEARIGKRLHAKRLNVPADWRVMLDAEFGPVTDEREEKARVEKEACLRQLASSRVSVLVGDAGTGKTKVLSVLCAHPDIKAGGVLLLAPTGKATVRLMDSMGDAGQSFKALNVAQFLIKSGRFDFRDMRYYLKAEDNNRSPEAASVPNTVIIDEASMLTEEMFGALMQALRKAERIIFVGDPNQLPPIGAGRPFVDLVSLLKKNLIPGAFPRVCDNYAELTINRRQKGNSDRYDVRLSKLFTLNEQMPDDDVIYEISKGEGSEVVRIERWTSESELEEKLLTVIAEELNMNDTADVDGFNAALGGKVESYATFFDIGAAKMVDIWQILAPIRNMPQGILNINRLIHNNYRTHYIELSKQRGYKKKIPERMGPEEIVYGDKVINVINTSDKKAWPEGAGRDYIANGEIGIACNCYATEGKKAHNYLNVEFSSQAGCTYSYVKSEFAQENGEPPLELAYALTVHKAQGSQFNTVILVLAEPCRIISRELLYTALTRQLDKIVILYNAEPYDLRKYSSPANSSIITRFTDLFASVSIVPGDDNRPQITKIGGKFYEERLIHKTARGELVRSKSEVIIANALYHHGIEYEYEAELVVGGRTKYPDFTIMDYDTGDTWDWEHCGMMSDPLYKARWEEKKRFYSENGIIENVNLIVTYDDENGGLDSSRIENLITKILD